MSSRHSFHLILFLASFGLSLASGIENYALIFYVRDLFGADKTAIGLIASGLDLFYFVGILVFLAWKKPHPRFVLWLAAWSMAGCILIYLAVPDWTVTFVFHCLFGLAMALFWPRIMGWLSWGVEGHELGRTMGRFNFSWAFGGILGPLLGGMLVEMNPRYPFFAAAGVLLVTGALMPLGGRLFAPMRERQPAVPVADEAAPDLSGPTPLRYPARLGIGGIYFLVGILIVIFPAYAKESLGFSETLSGTLLLVRLAVATLGFSLWGRWTFWHFRFWPLLAAMGAGVTLIALFPWGTQPWEFFLLYAAVGLVFSFLYSYALFHGVAGTKNRERSMTIHEAVLNVGLFLGTALGGWVSQTWSMTAAFVLAGGAMVVLAVAQVAVNRWFVCRKL